MAVLASAYEPLTLEEIACLCGGDWSGSRLLAGLASLRPFLNTERDLQGEVLFLRAEWKEAGKRALHESDPGPGGRLDTLRRRSGLPRAR
jgi:hypothetical protein